MLGRNESYQLDWVQSEEIHSFQRHDPQLFPLLWSNLLHLESPYTSTIDHSSVWLRSYSSVHSRLSDFTRFRSTTSSFISSIPPSNQRYWFRTRCDCEWRENESNWVRTSWAGEGNEIDFDNVESLSYSHQWALPFVPFTLTHSTTTLRLCLSLSSIVSLNLTIISSNSNQISQNHRSLHLVQSPIESMILAHRNWRMWMAQERAETDWNSSSTIGKWNVRERGWKVAAVHSSKLQPSPPSSPTPLLIPSIWLTWMSESSRLSYSNSTQFRTTCQDFTLFSPLRVMLSRIITTNKYDQRRNKREQGWTRWVTEVKGIDDCWKDSLYAPL